MLKLVYDSSKNARRYCNQSLFIKLIVCDLVNLILNPQHCTEANIRPLTVSNTKLISSLICKPGTCGVPALCYTDFILPCFRRRLVFLPPEEGTQGEEGEVKFPVMRQRRRC